MAVRRTKGGARGPRWVGGIQRMGAWVTGEGEGYRPEFLVWTSAEGLVLGGEVGRPGELLGRACAHLRATIAEPLVPGAPSPRIVRVASEELARVLRAGFPELTVELGPTPELDAVFAGMNAALAAGPPSEVYMLPQVPVPACRAFCEAAADLYRLSPWHLVPSSEDMFSFTAQSLGVNDALVTLLGQQGDGFAVLFFPTLAAFDDFATGMMDPGRADHPPDVLALNFDSLANLPDNVRIELEAQGWPVAGPNAYPYLLLTDKKVGQHPPALRDVTLAEALARALTKVLADPAPLHLAWFGGPPVTAEFAVETQAGPVDVRICAPHPAHWGAGTMDEAPDGEGPAEGRGPDEDA